MTVGNASRLGAHLMADEATFGLSTSTTFDERLAIIGEVDASGLTQEKIPLTTTKQFQADAVHGARGAYGGTFSLSIYLSGHGSATTGAVSANTEETYLGRVIGNLNVTGVGTDVASATNSSQFVLTGGTAVNGSVMRVGSISDDRGNGRFYAIDNPSTTTIFNAMEATPNATDVVFMPAVIHPTEDLTSDTVVSTRHQLLTANQRYNCYGCAPQSISITGLNPGELPQASITHQVAFWTEESASTWPSVTSVNEFTPSPVSGGAFQLQTVGTTTAALYDIRDFQLEIDMNIVPLMSTTTDNARAIIGGYRRTMCKAKFSFTVDAAAAGTNVFSDLWDASGATPVYQYVMYSLSCEDGSAIGLWFPKCHVTGVRPVQFSDGGLNRLRVSMEAVTTADTSSSLTLANFLLMSG